MSFKCSDIEIHLKNILPENKMLGDEIIKKSFSSIKLLK